MLMKENLARHTREKLMAKVAATIFLVLFLASCASAQPARSTSRPMYLGEYKSELGPVKIVESSRVVLPDPEAMLPLPVFGASEQLLQLQTQKGDVNFEAFVLDDDVPERMKSNCHGASVRELTGMDRNIWVNPSPMRSFVEQMTRLGLLRQSSNASILETGDLLVWGNFHDSAVVKKGETGGSRLNVLVLTDYTGATVPQVDLLGNVMRLYGAEGILTYHFSNN